MYVENRSRMIGFSPTDEYFAKGCFGITGVMPVPTLQPGQPNDFMTRLFQSAQQRISEEAQMYQGEKDTYHAAMATGKQIIETVIDAESARMAAKSINNLSHALTSRTELRTIFGRKLKEQGISIKDGNYVKEEADPA